MNLDFLMFAQQNANQPPDITNGWQFLYLALMPTFAFLTSIATLIISYLNGQKLSQQKTDIDINTTKTDVIHDIVKDVQNVQANQNMK